MPHSPNPLESPSQRSFFTPSFLEGPVNSLLFPARVFLVLERLVSGGGVLCVAVSSAPPDEVHHSESPSNSTPPSQGLMSLYQIFEFAFGSDLRCVPP